VHVRSICFRISIPKIKTNTQKLNFAMKTFYLFSQHAVGSLQFQKQQSLVDKLGIAENNFLIVSK